MVKPLLLSLLAGCLAVNAAAQKFDVGGGAGVSVHSIPYDGYTKYISSKPLPNFAAVLHADFTWRHLGLGAELSTARLARLEDFEPRHYPSVSHFRRGYDLVHVWASQQNNVMFFLGYSSMYDGHVNVHLGVGFGGTFSTGNRAYRNDRKVNTGDDLDGKVAGLRMRFSFGRGKWKPYMAGNLLVYSTRPYVFAQSVATVGVMYRLIDPR